MVRIGIVGIGFMGWIHYLATKRLQGARLAAVCSRDPKKLAGDWRGIRGNFGPPGEVVDLGGVKKYDRLEAMLADPDIDLIDVCNPTDQHPATANAALIAGKHVLVEKAIALKPEDADAMVALAKKVGKLLMVAHVLPFFPEFAYAAAAVREGTHGKLLGGHFKRVISRPTGRPTSATPPGPAARRWTCTSTTHTSSASSAACRSECSRPASSRGAPSPT